MVGSQTLSTAVAACSLPSSIRSSTRSMQGMFGASVSELYLLIKSLIIERTVDLRLSNYSYAREYTDAYVTVP